MAHISKIGHKSINARMAFILMYLALGIGGLTMAVPFFMMVSSSFKSSVDSQEYNLVPRYWYNRQQLAQKYLEQQFNYELPLCNAVTRQDLALITDLKVPAPANAPMVADYHQFVKTLPASYSLLSGRGTIWDARKYGVHPVIYAYRDYVLHKYRTLDTVSAVYLEQYVDGIESLVPPSEVWDSRWFQPLYNPRMEDFLRFKQQQAAAQLLPLPADGKWVDELKTKVSADLAAINAKFGTRYQSFAEITLPTSRPAGPLGPVWESYVRQVVPIWFVRVDASTLPIWQRFLRDRFKGDFTRYYQAHPRTVARGFDSVSLVGDDLYTDSVAVGEWTDFIGSAAPSTALVLDTPEMRFRARLRQRYGTIAAVNAAYGTQYASLETVPLPTLRVMTAECYAAASSIRWEFIVRNYRSVINYLLLHGRAFLNTILLVALSLLFTLTVNPIAAYALSRFKLKATNKILLFMLVTMAFPAEIAMIPSFLLLKDLHLLNTYWALILPGMASGFSIFLLKGMFDGLPQDLYEAAELDGAGELTIFWCVTMPLVKPFLAYLALGTFMGTYSAFMFAFLLCPNPKMWTIMVYLQQMDWASQPMQFAAFVLASIPTLIIFITCQRIIMQGIVLPTEK